MTTYIKDLIELPDQVRRGDFVLRLTEGVTKPQETVETYVVTPQLVRSFDDALGLIRSAVEGSTSKAAYLHGSFGSGKSHFMAILYLLLHHNAAVRSVSELAPVIEKHNAWIQGKKFLLITYYMIGAKDMESKILGEYVRQIEHLHPGTSIPGVYRSEALFRDAEALRADMGDEQFFAKLNKGGAGSSASGWGEIAAGWGPESFEAAITASPKSEERVRLVGDLVEKFYTYAKSGDSEFVDLDSGLSIISKHAKSLGYDGLILFLDELILWLASRAADVEFVTREGQKLIKLVESQTSDRPTPIISFVARQRDLRELVGDNLTGAGIVSFSDTLKHWEARFATIKLEDRNLPAIAEKRILKPKSEAARQQLDEAFRQTQQIQKEVLDVLLTSHSDPAAFRKVYPFSPALIDTLVDVSSLLQRERTALKIMLQLLVAQKDRLKLGDIVPVGDLFDAVAEGDEAFSDVMRVHFENAKKLYQQKLRPILERDHGMTFEQASLLNPDDPLVAALRNDDRLAKTLLLSALAPNVESLRGLTASRLAALNHGTIKSPIPGREGSIVLGKCRRWAAEIGQIKIGDEPTNPTISVQLTGVDTESILEQAQTVNNRGNQILKIKELLFGQLGIPQEDQLFVQYDFKWRATKRSCEVLVSNVRELTDESMEARGDDWKVIIDYPFDEGHGPRDDISKIETYKAKQKPPSRTILWMSSFLSRKAQKDLGTLVVLDHILTGERFGSYVTHLAPVDRQAAKTLLDNQRSQLRQQLIQCLESAYQATNPVQGALDTAHELTVSEHFQTLDPTFDVQPPVGANLQQAFQHLLGQALKHQFSAHPSFEDETNLGLAALKRVLAEVERATETADGRIAVDQPKRRELRQIANPLKLGEMHETHFLLGQHWKTHFLRKHAGLGGSMTVSKMRRWTDEPQGMGLPREVQNLIILAFALQTNRSFFLHGGPMQPTIENTADELELREQKLPSQADWEKARSRADAIFGRTSSPLLNAANMAKLIGDVQTEVTAHKDSCGQLVVRLKQLVPQLGTAGVTPTRLKTAQTTKSIVDALSQCEGEAFLSAMVGAEIFSSDQAMGTSFKKAGDVVDALSRVNWELLEAVLRLTDDRKTAAEAVWTSVKDAFHRDELAVAIGPALADAQSRAVKLLADVPKPVPAPTPGGPTQVTTAPTGPGKGTPTTATPSATYQKKYAHLDSDEAEVADFYKSDANALERNRQLVEQLKKLYGASQIAGDSVPNSLPAEKVREALEVHHIRPLSKGGADARSNMIVVSPTLHTLIHLDEKCTIDLAKHQIILFGVTITLRVDPGHNG
jgi:hypothetical protein